MSSNPQILVDEEQMKSLIPQRAPMLLVDKLLETSESWDDFTTSFSIPEDHVFVEKGRLREPGLIENLAQSAAAGIGYKQAQQTKEQSAPEVGYIGSVKNLEINKCPPAGQEIRTVISVRHEIFDVVMIHGEIWLHDHLLAEADMKVFHNSSQGD